MPEEKELKKNKLYLLELEYTFEDENGKEETAHDNLVGYVVGKEDDFFLGQPSVCGMARCPAETQCILI